MKLKPIVWIYAGVWVFVWVCVSIISYFNMQSITILLLFSLTVNLWLFVTKIVLNRSVLPALYKILRNLCLFLLVHQLVSKPEIKENRVFFVCMLRQFKWVWLCVPFHLHVFILFIVPSLFYIACVLISLVSIPKLGCVLFSAPFIQYLYIIILKFRLSIKTSLHTLYTTIRSINSIISLCVKLLSL